jgi:hypothetical protein
MRTAKNYNLRMAASEEMNNTAASPEVSGTIKRDRWKIYVIISRAMNRLIGTFSIASGVLFSKESQRIKSVVWIGHRASGHNGNGTSGSD